jgi:hypothetical protein
MAEILKPYRCKLKKGTTVEEWFNDQTKMINKRAMQIQTEMARQSLPNHIIQTTKKQVQDNHWRFSAGSDSMRVVEMLLNSDIAIAQRNIHMKLANGKL